MSESLIKWFNYFIAIALLVSPKSKVSIHVPPLKLGGNQSAIICFPCITRNGGSGFLPFADITSKIVKECRFLGLRA